MGRGAKAAPLDPEPSPDRAVELVTAARALDLRSPLAPARGTGVALAAMRELVPGPGPDRYLAPELEAAERLVASGDLLAAVERAVGPLA